MLTARTIVHHCSILKTPFDIVFKALFNCSYNTERSVQKYMFYKCGHISGPKIFPDMSLNAFDVKGCLPGPVDPQKVLNKYV